MTEATPFPADSGTPAAWHSLEIDAALKALGANSREGLQESEAQTRLLRFGANALDTGAKARWPGVLARQFKDVLIFILLAAAALSLIIGALGDAVTILTIVVLNAILGFVQEWKAEKAIEALARMLEPQCRVLREEKERIIDSRELVPGDIVILETGDRIPGDLRLVQGVNLTADESSLTGESESVSKDLEPVDIKAPLAERTSMAWMGTTITNGRGRGVVTATGMETEFGRIARLTQQVEREFTPLQRKLAVLGKQLGILAVLISAGVALTGWLLGKPFMEMLLTGVALAVAVVPEGLPAVVTITLALGVRAMAQRRALMRRLRASETLGAATVICTDKTGTLTQNEMTAQRIWTPSGELQVTGIGYDPAGHFEKDGQKIDPNEYPDLLALLETGLRCNHAKVTLEEDGWKEIGEPTEAALVVAAKKAWMPSDRPAPTLSEFAFNSSRKRMTIIQHLPDGLIAHVKGAPEVILDRCSRHLRGGEEIELGADAKEKAESAYLGLAQIGLRTLALARRELPKQVTLDEDHIERDLTLLGFVGIIDPPHTEVPEAIRLAGEAGIRVIMITGDAPATARTIAESIGLKAKRAITGSELDALDADGLRIALNEDILFARTTPEHKMRIVDTLQEAGQVVAMTGDGVNDAPALKAADIGIAMGLRGTDVAKAASDMALTDDNFSSIIRAVEEGRRQYDNIQKFVRYLLSSNMGELIAIFFNILLGGPLILLPVQILWMNLVTDGVTAVALGMEPAEKGIMKRPPRKPTDRILDSRGVLMILFLGGYIGIATLWLFHHYLDIHGEENLMLAQTVAFTGIIMLEKMNVFNFRALYAPIAQVGFFTNPWVLWAWAGNFLLQLSVIYVPFMQNAFHTVPLGLKDWGLILLLAIPIFLVTETFKWIQWRKPREPAN